MARQHSFEYPSLECDGQQFRIIKLEAPQADGSVHCKMLVRDLNDPSSYIALSYMWGRDDPTSTIILDGKDFKIRSNLAHFLARAQHWNLNPIFIDALCINQDDTDERNGQVRLMGHIYANAQRVISWLGFDNKEVEAAIPFIKQFLPLTNGVLRDFYKGKEDNIRQAQQPWTTVHLFCALRYWTRIWMVQEILKAKTITFVYGNQSIEGENLFQFSQALRETQPCPAPLADQLFQSRLFNYLDGINTKSLFHSGSITQANLVDVLWEYALSACGEKRDRVYALLSLAKEGSQFPVDYSQSMTKLYSQIWQFRPQTGSQLMVFAKHMTEALLDDWKDVGETEDSVRPKIYRFELHPVRCARSHISQVNADERTAHLDARYAIEYVILSSGPLRSLRTKAWPSFGPIPSRIKIRIDVDQIKNQAFEDNDRVFDVENSGLLVVARRNVQNEMQIVAKLAISVGLDHSDGTAEITARWLPWSSLLEKSKSKYQAYSVESIEDKIFMCYNEMSLRSFMIGLSYERHNMQFIKGTKHDSFEIDLLSVHWNVLPTGDFSLNEVAILRDVCDHLKNQSETSSLSLLRAIHGLTRSSIDLTNSEDNDENKPLPWRELLEREEGLNEGPTTSQLHKLFY